MFRSTRRGAVLGVAAATLTFTALPAFAAENIIIGVPAAQSGPVGVADHQDWTNGVQMAIEDINAAGALQQVVRHIATKNIVQAVAQRHSVSNTHQISIFYIANKGNI